jgi:sulfite reductase beta subunit-like hemoprotein
MSTVRRWSITCPAFPTCGLAVTEAERALSAVMDELEPELAKHGLSGERLTVRMTGCPKGCARPEASIRFNHPQPMSAKNAGTWSSVERIRSGV